MSANETPETNVSLDEEAAVGNSQHQFQSNVSEIARQSSISFLGTTSTLVVGYVFRVYLARTLGAKLLGWNALGIGLYALFRMVGDLGLPWAASRYVAVYSSTNQPERLRSFFWRALRWMMLGSCALSVFLIVTREWIALRFFHDIELASYLPFYAALIPIGAANSFALHTLTGLKKVSRRIFITNFISVPFMMLATVFAVSSGFSLRGYITAQILGESIALVLAAWSIRQYSPIPLTLSRIRGAGIEPAAWWFSLALLAMTVLEYASSRADRLILGHYMLARDIGIYAVASSAAGLCSLVLQALNTIFGPVIADLHARHEQQLLLRLFQTLTKWVIALTVPLILMLMVFSGTVMGIFGAEFKAGAAVLAVLSLGQLANVGTGSVGTMLYMSGNQNKMLPVQVVVAFLSVAGNFVLIPMLGIKGAGIVAVLSVAAMNIGLLIVVRRKMQLFPYNASYIRLIIPTTTTALAIWLLHAQLVNRLPPLPLLAVAFAISYVVFLACLLAVGLTEDDRVVVELARERIRPFFHNRRSQLR